MWGESFEGCVPGYGSAWAHGLRLEIPPAISFDHCVCDAPFMYQARPRGALLVHLGPSDHSMHGAVVWTADGAFCVDGCDAGSIH